jgi:hypothetical protein
MVEFIQGNGVIEQFAKNGEVLVGSCGQNLPSGSLSCWLCQAQFIHMPLFFSSCKN